MMPNPPDIEQIAEDKTELEGAWSATHAQFAIIDSFTNGTYSVWPHGLEGRHTERTNRGRSIIDHATDSVMPYKPRLVRDEQDKVKNETQGDIDDVEVAGEAVWTNASQAEKRLPAKVVGRDMVKYNYGGFETGFSLAKQPTPPEKGDPDYAVKAKDYEQRKGDFNPFFLKPIHPYSVLISPTERIPSLVVKRERMSKKDIAQILSDARSAIENGEDNIVTVYDYELVGNKQQMVETVRHYTPEYTTFTAADSAGVILLQEENRHGIVPFRHAFGGFGDTEANQDGLNPEKLGQGLIWPVRTLIQQYDQIRSAEMEIWAMTAFGPLVTPGSAAELAAKLEASTQAIIGNISVKDMGFLPSPQLPQFMAELADRLDREITEMTIPRPSYGQREVGVDTVGQHALMVSLARNRFTETMEQLAFMTGEIVSMWLQMLLTWGQEIVVGGHRLSPAMLNGSTHITAMYPQSDEAVRMQRVQQGADLVQRGLKSKKRFWEEDAMIDDTSGEQEQIDLEQVMADPILTAAKAEKIRRGAGVQQMYEEQLARMAAMEQNGATSTAEPSGKQFQAPATEAQGEIRQAISNETVKPAPAGPGTERGA